MAQVKCTQDTWERITSKINEMFAKRQEYASDWYNYGLTKAEFDEAIMNNLIPPEQRDLVDKLGKRFFQKHKQLIVKIDGTFYTLEFEARFIPEHWTNRWHDDQIQHVRAPKILEIAKAREKRMSEIDEAKTAFIEKVQALYNEAPSINTLIKLWPPIVDLLPAEIMERVNKRVDRKSAKKLAEQLDTSELAVHMLKAKVAA